MRWGIFGARGDRRGLAIQTGEIARNLRPDKVLGIEMGQRSPFPADWQEFDQDRLTVRALEDLLPADVAGWLADLDVVFGCETFYVPWLTDVAHRAGTATVLQVNPEFAQHVYDWEPVPTMIVSPTAWRAEHLPGCTVLPVGVARDRLPYRPRVRLNVALHVVGHGAIHDRNGTTALIDALRFVKRPLAVIVRSQRPLGLALGRLPRWVEVEVRAEDVGDYWRLYDEGDLLVLPRRYGGLCLPAQEALSTGMPVLMPDTSPNADWLPPGMLVPLAAPRPGRHFQSQVGRIDLADTDPALLAFRLDHLAAHPEEMQALSGEARRIADGLSWPALAQRYMDTLRAAATAVASGA
jgi:glycosyltransferase involved in cell wall biosynthesis